MFGSNIRTKQDFSNVKFLGPTAVVFYILSFIYLPLCYSIVVDISPYPRL